MGKQKYSALTEEQKILRREKSRQAMHKWRTTKPEEYKKSKQKSDAKYRAKHPDRWRKRFLKQYGITLTEYEALLAAQNFRCAICKTDNPGKRRKFWSVDHHRETHAIRGLLCLRCNWGLGFFSHDPVILQAAIDYL